MNGSAAVFSSNKFDAGMRCVSEVRDLSCVKLQDPWCMLRVDAVTMRNLQEFLIKILEEARIFQYPERIAG